MNSDTTTLIFGSLVSVILSQAGTGMDEYGIFEILKGISASGVLAVTFWWIMKRFETRLDKAFEAYALLSKELLDILKDRNENGK